MSVRLDRPRPRRKIRSRSGSRRSRLRLKKQISPFSQVQLPPRQAALRTSQRIPGLRRRPRGTASRPRFTPVRKARPCGYDSAILGQPPHWTDVLVRQPAPEEPARPNLAALDGERFLSTELDDQHTADCVHALRGDDSMRASPRSLRAATDSASSADATRRDAFHEVFLVSGAKAPRRLRGRAVARRHAVGRVDSRSRRVRRGDRTQRRGQEHSAHLDWRYCVLRWRGQSAWSCPESAAWAQEFGPMPQRKVTPVVVASDVAFAVFAIYLAAG